MAHDPKPTFVMFNPLRPRGRVGNDTATFLVGLTRFPSSTDGFDRSNACDRLRVHGLCEGELMAGERPLGVGDAEGFSGDDESASRLIRWC
jgi:hypothetical protein